MKLRMILVMAANVGVLASVPMRAAHADEHSALRVVKINRSSERTFPIRGIFSPLPARTGADAQ
jgi:hypothetical protein